MLDLPKRIIVKGRDGKLHDDVPMWKYWCLEEGTLGVDPNMHKTNDGGCRRSSMSIPMRRFIPTSTAADHRQAVGPLLQARLQFRRHPGRRIALQGRQDPDEVAIDPYGPDSPDFIVGDNFVETWCSMLAHCQKRFEGKIGIYKQDEKSGGLGCFTPDNFPVFDMFRENVYVIANSNHGYKMIGVGKLVAQEMWARRARLLEPFRFSRYAKGELHPARTAPSRGAEVW